MYNTVIFPATASLFGSSATNSFSGGSWQQETDDPRCISEVVFAGPGNLGTPEFDLFCQHVVNHCRCRCQAISDQSQIITEVIVQYDEAICLENRPCKSVVHQCCNIPDIPCNTDPWGDSSDPFRQNWIPPKYDVVSECSPFGEPTELQTGVPFIFLSP